MLGTITQVLMCQALHQLSHLPGAKILKIDRLHIKFLIISPSYSHDVSNKRARLRLGHCVSPILGPSELCPVGQCSCMMSFPEQKLEVYSLSKQIPGAWQDPVQDWEWASFLCADFIGGCLGILQGECVPWSRLRMHSVEPAFWGYYQTCF